MTNCYPQITYPNTLAHVCQCQCVQKLTGKICLPKFGFACNHYQCNYCLLGWWCVSSEIDIFNQSLIKTTHTIFPRSFKTLLFSAKMILLFGYRRIIVHHHFSMTIFILDNKFIFYSYHDCVYRRIKVLSILKVDACALHFGISFSMSLYALSIHRSDKPWT